MLPTRPQTPQTPTDSWGRCVSRPITDPTAIAPPRLEDASDEEQERVERMSHNTTMEGAR
jgi:hypothetical protein